MHRFVPRLTAAVLTLVVLAFGVVPATAAAERETIDLNKAGVQQLTELPGVGEAIAKRIVAFREENGPFKRVEDLLKVKGIGEKSFDKLRPYIRVGKAQ